MTNNYSIYKSMLCMIVGVAGSGKTLLAHQLAKQLLNGVFFSKDMIQNCFTKTERANGETYELIRGPSFDLLVNFADVQVSHGKIPIIDAPFSRNFRLKDKYADWISPFRKIAAKHNARLVIIRCKAPSEDELKKRLKDRGCVWDKWKLENWSKFKELEPADFPIPHNDVFEVVSDKPVEELSRMVLVDYLKAKLSAK